QRSLPAKSSPLLKSSIAFQSTQFKNTRRISNFTSNLMDEKGVIIKRLEEELDETKTQLKLRNEKFDEMLKWIEEKDAKIDEKDTIFEEFSKMMFAKINQKEADIKQKDEKINELARFEVKF